MATTDDDDDRNRDSRYAFRLLRCERIRAGGSGRRPQPRSGHRIAADSANLYSFGGYNPTAAGYDVGDEDDDEDNGLVFSYPLFRELWRFNFASRRWRKFGISDSLPPELASNAVLLHRNYLMVYGGTGSPFGFRCSNQLFVCKLNKDGREEPMMEIHTGGQIPCAMYGQALVHHDDHLYTIGGTTGLRYSCNIHRLNLTTAQWERVYMCNGAGDYEPEGRYRHEVCFDGRHIYVLGGGTADQAFDLQNIPAFDVQKRSWRLVATGRDAVSGYPAPRRCHASVQVDRCSAFIVGGHDGETAFGDLWRLDLPTMRWFCVRHFALPLGTYFHDAAATPEGKLYVFGGINTVEENVFRNNKVFSAWLKVPKLSEMCWEAILFYSPHIVDSRRDRLLDSGLPVRFVDRLEGPAG